VSPLTIRFSRSPERLSDLGLNLGPGFPDVPEKVIVEVGEARPLMGTIEPAKNHLSEQGD
jgi:hypothetical protein